jgi:hypothetical protein
MRCIWEGSTTAEFPWNKSYTYWSADKGSKEGTYDYFNGFGKKGEKPATDTLYRTCVLD